LTKREREAASPASPHWIALAEVARPHGVRGEVRLKVYNKDSDLLLELDEVLVRLRDGEEHEVSIERARRADDAVLMKLYSINDRDRADELRGATVCARREQFPPLGEGEFYACDVMGARAVLGDGRELGKVRDLRAYPSVDVLVVTAEDGQRDWEIPLVDAFVEGVDAGAGVVRIRTVEGLDR
jgi:16S rRNA processing protein RimM